MRSVPNYENARITADVCYLTLECDGIRLTLGTDASWPRRMFPAARLDLTTDVLQHSKLASETTQYNYNYNNNYYCYNYYNTEDVPCSQA